MHLWRLGIALPLFAAFTAGAAVVYKWTDPDGVVHYSDQAVPGAEKIVTSSGTANGVSGGPKSGPAAATQAPSALNYHVMTIDSPADQDSFFGDNPVPIHLHLEPALQPNQTITWNLNGKQLEDQAADATSVTLQSLSRGTYAIAATVTDVASGQSQSTNSVTFYVRQPSERSPQHKSP